MGFWEAADLLHLAERAAASIGSTSPGTAKRGSPADYIHIIDRRPHDQRVQDCCDERYATGSKKPAIILLHGRDVDDPTSYSTRWQSGDLEYKRLTGNVIQTMSGFLNWPVAAYGPETLEKRLSKLKAEFARCSLQPPSGSAVDLPLSENDSPERFQTYFAAGRLPRTFSLILKSAKMKPEDYDILSDFLKFFAAAAAGPDVVTLFIALWYQPDAAVSFVDLEPDSEPRSADAAAVWAALKRCVLLDNLHLWDVGALTQIEIPDVADWRQKLERRDVRPSESFFLNLNAKIVEVTSVPLTRFSQLVAQPL